MSGDQGLGYYNPQDLALEGQLDTQLQNSQQNNSTLVPEIVNGNVQWVSPSSFAPVSQQQASIPQFQTSQTPTVNMNNIASSTGTTPTSSTSSTGFQAPTNTLGAPPVYNSVPASGGGKGGMGGGMPSSMNMPQAGSQAFGASYMPALFNSVSPSSGVSAGGAK